VRSIIFRGRDERELAEELRFHTEMDAELLQRSGLSAGEARRQSALMLGGVERVKEDVRDARGTRLFHDVGRDFGFAVRTLMRNPGFATVAILTLAVGIGGTTAVFSAVDAVHIQVAIGDDDGVAFGRIAVDRVEERGGRRGASLREQRASR